MDFGINKEMCRSYLYKNIWPTQKDMNKESHQHKQIKIFVLTSYKLFM